MRRQRDSPAFSTSAAPAEGGSVPPPKPEGSPHPTKLWLQHQVQLQSLDSFIVRVCWIFPLFCCETEIN